ncbi:MAG: hypothetical protein V4613_11445 [Bacteroidota bacterium]
MNTSALIMMIVTEAIVTIMTIYYFVKVLRTPARDPQNDSYSETK